MGNQCMSNRPKRQMDPHQSSFIRRSTARIETYDKVKSKIFFGGNEMMPQQLQNGERWTPARPFAYNDEDRFARDEDDRFEANDASKSNLKSEKQILT